MHQSAYEIHSFHIFQTPQFIIQIEVPWTPTRTLHFRWSIYSLGAPFYTQIIKSSFIPSRYILITIFAHNISCFVSLTNK